MDHTTETRGERSIPADKLAALYEAKRENERLRRVVERCRDAFGQKVKNDAVFAVDCELLAACNDVLGQ